MDVVYLEQPTWSEEDERHTEEGRAIFGIHDETVFGRLHSDEFPLAPRPKVATYDSRAAAEKRKARRKDARKGRKRNR